MAEYLIQSETLDAIADAINAKTGGSSAMTPAQMVTAIGSISGGGGGWTDVVTAKTYANGNALRQLFVSLGFSSYVAVRIDNDPGNSEVSYFLYGQTYFLSHDGQVILAYNIRRNRANDYGAASIEGNIPSLPIGSKFKVLEVAFGE